MVKICRMHTMLDGSVMPGEVSVRSYKSVASAKGSMGQTPIHDIDPVTAQVFHDHFPKNLAPKAHGTLFSAPHRKVGDISKNERGLWFTEVFICEEEVTA